MKNDDQVWTARQLEGFESEGVNISQFAEETRKGKIKLKFQERSRTSYPKTFEISSLNHFLRRKINIGSEMRMKIQ